MLSNLRHNEWNWSLARNLTDGYLQNTSSFQINWNSISIHQQELLDSWATLKPSAAFHFLQSFHHCIKLKTSHSIKWLKWACWVPDGSCLYTGTKPTQVLPHARNGKGAYAGVSWRGLIGASTDVFVLDGHLPGKWSVALTSWNILRWDDRPGCLTTRDSTCLFCIRCGSAFQECFVFWVLAIGLAGLDTFASPRAYAGTQGNLNYNRQSWPTKEMIYRDQQLHIDTHSCIYI